MTSLNVILIVPPVAYIGYPTLECATLSALFSLWGVNIKVLELNLDLLEYFIDTKGDMIRAALEEIYGQIQNSELIYLDKIAEIFDFEENHQYLDLLATNAEYKLKVIKKIRAAKPQLACIVLEHMRVGHRADQSLLWLGKILKRVMGDKGRVVLTGSLINAIPLAQRQMLEKLECIDSVIPVDPVRGWTFESFFPNVKSNSSLESNLMILPDFSQMECKKYINFRAGTRIFPFRTSSGCKFQCTYCIDTRIWGPYKELPLNVLEELYSKFIEHYQPDVIRFLDLLVNANPERLAALAKLLTEIQRRSDKRKPFYWVGMATADIPISQKLAQQLYDSGCRNLWLGLESDSSPIRQVMNKVISPDFPKTLTNLKKAGISTLIYLIANYPGMNERETIKTEIFLEKNIENIDYILLSKFRLYKNSLMGVAPEKFGITVRNNLNNAGCDDLRPLLSSVFNNYSAKGIPDYERLFKKWQELKRINNITKKIFTIEDSPILTEI